MRRDAPARTGEAVLLGPCLDGNPPRLPPRRSGRRNHVMRRMRRISARRACSRLAMRLDVLEERLQGGDETAWPEFLEAVKVLSALLLHLAPSAHCALLR